MTSSVFRVEADDLQISGVYPHLTTYGVYSENGAHTKKGHDEVRDRGDRAVGGQAVDGQLCTAYAAAGASTSCIRSTRT